MPVTPGVMGAYLAADGEGYAVLTLRCQMAAIARACGHRRTATRHQASGHSETVRRIHREHGVPPRQSTVLTTTEVYKLVRACGATLAATRDCALFLIGFAGANLLTIIRCRWLWSGKPN